MNPVGGPGVDVEFHMDPLRHGGNLAQRPWAEVLIALRGTVPGRVGYADQCNVRIGGIAVEGSPEEGGNIPPVKGLQHHFVGVRKVL